MRELVVISGKGGTGKTSITASFAALSSEQVVAADCDVDAPDLQFVLRPTQRSEHDFCASEVAEVDSSLCDECGTCRDYCRFGAIDAAYRIDDVACEGCGLCELVCPRGAVQMREISSGCWFMSDSPCGPLVHARLNFGEGNSGKLVARVREAARVEARRIGADLILVDGPPGIGCPVIASIAGVSAALIVTEPSPSGLHDLRRVVQVCDHFSIPAAVCINRCDLDMQLTRRIAAVAQEEELSVLGHIPYDNNVTKAQMQKRSAVEYAGGPAADSIRELWGAVVELLNWRDDTE